MRVLKLRVHTGIYYTLRNENEPHTEHNHLIAMSDQYSDGNGPLDMAPLIKVTLFVCVQIMPLRDLITITSHSMQSFIDLCFVFNARK